MIVCVCKSVSDREIAEAISEGAASVKEVARRTCAGTCCGSCHGSIRQAIDMHHGRAAKPRVVLPTLAALTS